MRLWAACTSTINSLAIFILRLINFRLRSIEICCIPRLICSLVNIRLATFDSFVHWGFVVLCALVLRSLCCWYFPLTLIHVNCFDGMKGGMRARRTALCQSINGDWGFSFLPIYYNIILYTSYNTTICVYCEANERVQRRRQTMACGWTQNNVYVMAWQWCTPELWLGRKQDEKFPFIR